MSVAGMLHGPGRYDAECTAARESAHALGVILIVIGGDRGDGVSVQCDVPTLLVLPELLDDVVANIRRTRDAGGES